MPDESELNTVEYFFPDNKVDFEIPKLFSSLIKIDFGALSDVGKVRQNNEDAFLIFRTGRYWQKLLTNLSEDVLPERNDENAYAMAVADGMGGRAAGEVASSMALVTVVNLMFSSVKWALKLDHPGLRDQEIQEGIERAVQYLNKADFAISKRAEADPSLSGMGSTLTACYSFGDDLFVFHIGDSRAYLFRDGQLTQLTRDHTVAQGLADAGAIPQEKVQNHHLKHMLTRAMGRHDGNVEVEIHRLTLADNDQVLLCSDGLTDLVSPDDIAATLRTAVSSQTKCDTLIRLALENGGKDNVTALVASYQIPAKQ